jgi:hypothetical protein
MGPGAASIASIGALGLGSAPSILKGYGEQQGQEFMAAQAERAAQLGRIKATQTDTALREELATTLGNIDVIRAAANASPLSPTAQSIRAKETEVSDRQRTQAVANIRAQVAEKEAEAEYRRKAGNIALLGGIAGGASSVAKSLFG